MKYEIEYKHLIDELITNDKTQRRFNKVKNTANKYSLELSDDDFKHFFKLQEQNIDIGWLMHKMTTYKMSLTGALISYITY